MADEELQVTFTLENEPLEADFELEEQAEVDANFIINASPEKVSQLENDLNFQTGEQVAASIEAESDIINARIDSEVETLNTEINKKVETITGSPLIDAQRADNTVTLTSKTFVFEQAIASKVWEIEHNLNKRPSIILTYYNGEQFEGYREYIDNNNARIILENAATGYAYLN
jgi:hypothetical protein